MYVFPLGAGRDDPSPRLRDWDRDGYRDALLQEGATIKIWRGTGRTPWFPLRPDVEIPMPPGYLWAAWVLPNDASGDANGAGGANARDEADATLVAIDANGVLVWGNGADWHRAYEGPLWFGDGAGAIEPPRVLLDDGERLADFDGDGRGDLVVVDRDGAWRIVWGPLAAGVACESTRLPTAQPATRTDLETFGPPATLLSGLTGTYMARARSGEAAFVRSNRVRPGGEVLAARTVLQLSPTELDRPPDAPSPTPGRADSLAWKAGAVPGLLDLSSYAVTFRQTAPRTFEAVPRDRDVEAPSSEPEALPIVETTYEDRLRSWADDLAARNTKEDRTSILMRDIDGDGTPDALLAFGSYDLLQPRTVLSVYLGRADGTLPDARRPDSVLRTRAVYAHPVLTDIDRDGDLDTAMFFFNHDFASPADQLKAYLQLGISGTLRVYPWDAADGYSEKRSHARELNLRYEVFGMSTPDLFDARLNGDHDGDGINDLGFITAAGTYTVWRLDPARGFGAKPMLEVTTPDRIVVARAVRIDNDERADLYLLTRDDNSGRESCRVFLMR